MSPFPINIICETSTVVDGSMSFLSGNQSEVVRNRNSFLRKCGVTQQRSVSILCDHGETIKDVTGSDAQEVTSGAEGVKAEAVVTQTKNLPLFLLTADCQPMSFFDPVTQTIALAHVSRVTLGKQLPQKVVSHLVEHFGVKPEVLQVYIGPHIHKESYRFSLPLLHKDPNLSAHIYERDGYAHIDLTGGSIEALTASGVKENNISISDIDTTTSENHFSYFKLKHENKDTTSRIATVLMLRKE
jgi:copper oxidase (laccase) domain-containing protein